MDNRPRCANMYCENDGWVNVGGMYYCGNCVTKLDKKQKERLRKEMEDL